MWPLNDVKYHPNGPEQKKGSPPLKGTSEREPGELELSAFPVEGAVSAKAWKPERICVPQPKIVM